MDITTAAVTLYEKEKHVPKNKIKRTCKVCKKDFLYDSYDEIEKDFYKKKTHSGTCYLKTCKECEKAKHRDKYKSGEYNWFKRNQQNYDRDIFIGSTI
jgi:hypothetical protein